jgi:hypothetical protein
MKSKFWARRIMKIFVLALAATALFTFVVMSLWNLILVNVLHVGVITFWQALGILVLSKILFGGFRGGWRGRGHMHGPWRKEMIEKWQTMSPEEREKFQQDWKSRCGYWKRNAPEEQQANAATK